MQERGGDAGARWRYIKYSYINKYLIYKKIKYILKNFLNNIFNFFHKHSNIFKNIFIYFQNKSFFFRNIFGFLQKKTCHDFLLYILFLKFEKFIFLNKIETSVSDLNNIVY